MNILPWLVAALLWAPDPDVLRLTLVGNAGVLLTDGETSLLVDLPYESGYSGYEEYRFGDLAPEGRVVSVITHHHADHFDPELFRARDGWELIGPESVTGGLEPGAVLAGDSVVVGRFHVVALGTPHTPDHRSYRVRWGGRIFHFTGDTEDPSSLRASPPLDVLFITPWLSCAAERADIPLPADRAIAYHLRAAGGDRVCASAEVLEQGTSFDVEW